MMSLYLNKRKHFGFLGLQLYVQYIGNITYKYSIAVKKIDT